MSSQRDSATTNLIAWTTEISKACEEAVGGLLRLEQESRQFVGGFVRLLAPLEHLRTVLDPETSQDDKAESGRSLIRWIWKGNLVQAANPKARLGIKGLREKFIGMEAPLLAAVILAYADSQRPQEIRFGKHGRKFRGVVPEGLALRLYYKWLSQRAHAHFEAMALEEYSDAKDAEEAARIDPKQKRGRRKRSHSSSHDTLAVNYVEDNLIAQLDKKAEVDLFALLDAPLLSHQQQVYVEHKVYAFRENPDFTDARARAFACKNMGITPNHARQLELQIRKKVSKIH